MKQLTHIRAPWIYEYWPYRKLHTNAISEDKDIPCFRIYAEDDEKFIAETNPDWSGEQQEAQASLITAAPELFEALEFFYNVMGDYQNSLQKGYVQQALDRARSALASAVGGV